MRSLGPSLSQEQRFPRLFQEAGSHPSVSNPVSLSSTDGALCWGGGARPMMMYGTCHWAWGEFLQKRLLQVPAIATLTSWHVPTSDHLQLLFSLVVLKKHILTEEAWEPCKISYYLQDTGKLLCSVILSRVCPKAQRGKRNHNCDILFLEIRS